jgi:hypothetical protein
MIKQSHRIRLFVVLTALFSVGFAVGCLAQCTKAEVEKLKKKAFIVGEAQYSNFQLTNAVNDAKDIASALARIGFDTVVEINAPFGKLNADLRRWIATLGEANVALFYFAGHGFQNNGRNYLCAIDAPNSAQLNEVETKALEGFRIQGDMETLNKHINILLLDACREDPTRSFLSRNQKKQGLAYAPSTQRGTIIGYPVQPGKNVPDGLGRNSLYARAIIDNFQIPRISVMKIFQRIEQQVYAVDPDERPETSFSGSSAYDICLYFPDDLSASGDSSYFSNPAVQADQKSFRSDLENEATDIPEDSLKKIFDNIQRTLNLGIDSVLIGMGPKFAFRAAGWSPDFSKPVFRSMNGIARQNYFNVYLAPTTTATITADHRLLFSMTSPVEIAQFEKDNNLAPEKPLDYPLSDIQYKAILFSIERYFFSRREFLELSQHRTL